ncbi:MAG: metal-dependent phosphohydrolase [Acidobacteriota bacterium]|nr:metal-dependent phosphohydrolase [Acidobacteriota bacterium]MDH3522637.1 metal-dependent phosphohydrolase [Acidobacteriota bacterium]
MFEPARVLIGQVVAKLESDFRSVFGAAHDDRSELLTAVGRLALERIAACDAVYHNLNHTMLVTLVGNDILRGKLATGSEISPGRWLDFVVSLLCHDIGFVRPLCREDRNGLLASGRADETFALPREATDAALAPYHVDRGILFIGERLSDQPLLNVAAIAANIDRTRFPVPDAEEYRATDDDPGLVRAADLLGQVSETWVRRRYPALFYEFEETGVNRRLGFSCPHDLLVDFPRFYAKVVVPYCGEAFRLLEATADGRGWLSNLHFHLADIEAGLGESPS